MYFVAVLLLMLVLPAGSIPVEHFYFNGTPVMMLVGKWFVFWSAGVRLLLAGLRQFFQPAFTLKHIFDIQTDDALPLVRELGVANAATGVVGVASLANPSFVLPAAIASSIFFGVAGVQHAAASRRSANETIAMLSDLFVFLVLAAYLGFVAIS